VTTTALPYRVSLDGLPPDDILGGGRTLLLLGALRGFGVGGSRRGGRCGIAAIDAHRGDSLLDGGDGAKGGFVNLGVVLLPPGLALHKRPAELAVLRGQRQEGQSE